MLPWEIAIADWMLGASHHLTGNQILAQRHFEAGMEYTGAPGHFNTSFFGYERVRALVILSRVLWLRGLSDRAAVVARQATQEARKRDQPIDVCISLTYTARRSAGG